MESEEIAKECANTVQKDRWQRAHGLLRQEKPLGPSEERDHVASIIQPFINRAVLKALETYGQHDTTCPMRLMDCINGGGNACDCGFDAALKAVEAKNG